MRPEGIAPTARPFRLHRRPEERVRALGGEMDLVRPEEVLWFVVRKVDAGERAIVANHNMHSLYLRRCDPQVRSFYRKADLIEVDSTPVIHWARLVGRPSRPFHRCTYLDWRDMFWTLAAFRGWKVFYLGGGPGVAEMAAKSLKARYPGLKIATHDGYFDASQGSEQNAEVLQKIQKFEPQIVFVGMGMPRQEIWIEENAEALPPCVMFSVGAAFDYEAGVQKPAPRWMGEAGVEWLYRLLRDPRRLFSRYCIEPWFLVPEALADLKQAIRRRLDERTAARVRSA